MIKLGSQIPDHHLFKGEKAKIIKTFRPFIKEKSKQIIYNACIIEVNGQTLEIWSDENNNIWFNKI